MESIISINLRIDSEKCILPEIISLRLDRGGDSYYVYFGGFRIFSSESENNARKFYDKTREVIESGNYQLILGPDFRPEIRQS